MCGEGGGHGDLLHWGRVSIYLYDLFLNAAMGIVVMLSPMFENKQFH